jgi:hypothetical protein
VEAAVLPWQLVPGLISDGGFRPLCDVLDLLEELGAPPVATTFFVVRPDFAIDRKELVVAFIAAYCAAVRVMRASGRAWLKGVVAAAGSPGTLMALRAAWSRRICCEWAPHDRRSLQVFSQILEDAGSGECVSAASIPQSLLVPSPMNLRGRERWLP